MYETQIDSGANKQKHVIVIGDKSYEVPLMGDLPYAELDSALDGMDGYKAFLEKHLTKKVVEKLSLRQLRALMDDWGKYSKDDMGITPGES